MKKVSFLFVLSEYVSEDKYCFRKWLNCTTWWFCPLIWRNWEVEIIKFWGACDFFFLLLFLSFPQLKFGCTCRIQSPNITVAWEVNKKLRNVSYVVHPKILGDKTLHIHFTLSQLNRGEKSWYTTAEKGKKQKICYTPN